MRQDVAALLRDSDRLRQRFAGQALPTEPAEVRRRWQAAYPLIELLLRRRQWLRRQPIWLPEAVARQQIAAVEAALTGLVGPWRDEGSTRAVPRGILDLRGLSREACRSLHRRPQAATKSRVERALGRASRRLMGVST